MQPNSLQVGPIVPISLAMAYVIPDEFITPPPAGYLETVLYVKHVAIKGKLVQSFDYVKQENTTFVEYLLLTRGNQSLDQLMTVSFKPAGVRNDRDTDSSQEILQRGILFSGSLYRFLGHSNSQLKDKTCFLINSTQEEIYELFALFGDFAKIKSLAKRAKRIGLLFSAFRRSLSLREHEYTTIPDIKRGRYNFTDGCGFMSMELATEIQHTHNLNYTPCVVQVRYQGFKGVLLLLESMEPGLKVQFRESMRKFKIPDEGMRSRCTTLGVLGFSRPYSNGYLNTQITMLLADGRVSPIYLKDLQQDYYYTLDNLGHDRAQTELYLRTTGKFELLERLRNNGMHEARVQRELKGQRTREIKNMTKDVEVGEAELDALPAHQVNRQKTSKLRVLVPKARLVYGVCDPFDELNYGECYFQPTLPDEEQMQEFYEAEQVIVVRNPCYHPGDVRVLKLVKSNPRYAYLSDCVVFPVRGHRPHADESSGGDLDGDKFFVSWDVNLIPRWPSKPFDYSPVNYVDMIAGLISDKVGRSALALKLAAQRLAQDHLPSVFGRPEEAEKRHKLQERQSQLAYFATYSNDLVCRVDAIFMKYAGRFGPSCQECVFLNGFFSAAVDMVAHRDAVLKDLRRLERHFHQNLLPERAFEEAFRQFLAYMEWSKPVFRPGDDVWTTMQQQATEFVDQMGRMHPSQQGRR